MVDFNSYFASVEQQERAELRGKAVAVVPVMAESTCCIAASYPAKQRGVSVGTPVAEARQKCPGIVILEARPEIYIRYHNRLIAAVEKCVHVSAVLSIDEMACELNGSWAEKAKALKVAAQIKRTIAKDVGECMTSSIGIGPNVLLAKMASDMMKPDGLVFLGEEELPQKLFELELGDVPGIGENMEARLRAAGIDTLEKLWHARREELRKVWRGIEGDRMYDGLHGQPVYRPATVTSTIGHSHVLPPALRNRDGALATLHRLLQKAAMRLRHAGYYAGGMHLSIKELGRGRWSDGVNFLETQDTRELIRVFHLLWERRPESWARRPLAVGVTLFNLVPATQHNGTLFETGDARKKLNAALDVINRKLGKNTVYYGGAMGALEFAPVRIAFNRIPDVALEEGDEAMLATEEELAKFRTAGRRLRG